MRPDLVVVGGGVIGLSIALAAAKSRKVVVLEKEPRPGLHQSGRNSGVLHAGFYYAADSLKARLCRDGNARWTAFCAERGLPIRRCGKLVVARSEADHAGLDELLARATRNGVELHAIDAAEARRIEPRVRTAGRALWSPTTSSVDPAALLDALADECATAGVEIRTGTAFVAPTATGLTTTSGDIDCGYVVNAAGLQADRVAHAYGVARHLRILPFKGLYLEGDETFRTHVYPVPDLGMPFLGVHVTVAVDGHAKLGPTALPALWRENYGGLANFRADELVDVATRQAGLFARDAAFRRLARAELPKVSRRTLARQATALVELDPSRWRRWGRPGIRAQLFDTEKRRLEMDFRIEADERALHVLNAVSPAFTCALPFADLVAARLPG